MNTSTVVSLGQYQTHRPAAVNIHNHHKINFVAESSLHQMDCLFLLVCQELPCFFASFFLQLFPLSPSCNNSPFAGIQSVASPWTSLSGNKRNLLFHTRSLSAENILCKLSDTKNNLSLSVAKTSCYGGCIFNVAVGYIAAMHVN